jgi:putative ABC transport system substrate-binding protein
MRRREFIAGLGGVAAWPLAARAQQRTLPMVGFLIPGGSSQIAEFLPLFRSGLAERGYVEGRNVVIEYRFAEGKYERLPTLAADLVRLNAAVLIANAGTVAVPAALAASPTTPIVFISGVDSVRVGVVARLNRPGGGRSLMRRRQFIAGLGSAAVWPVVARAQQPALPVIGFVNSASPGGHAPFVAAFRQGLKETGYVEGQNVAIEFRWAEGQYDRVPAMAAELVRRQVAVIVANTPGNLAAKAATATIPIVFTTASDPVQLGLVASLSRPGGNVTGATQFGVEVTPKLLELARELMPTATVIAVLVNPTNPNTEALVRDLQAAARILGVQLHILHASADRDFDTASHHWANCGQARS